MVVSRVGLLRTYLALLFLATTAFGQTEPMVAGFFPADGSVNVPLNARIVIPLNFSNGMRTEAVLLRNGTAVAGKTEYFDQWAVYTPATQFEANTPYEIRLANTLTGQTFASKFTTGAAPDLSAPLLASSEPADGQDAAHLTRPLRLHFSKVLNPASVQNAKFQLWDLTSGYSIDLTGTLMNDATTIQLNAQYGLALGRAYRIYLPETPILDWTGQALPKRGPVTFTTFTRPLKGGPMLTGSAPFDGETAVPTNSTVILVFDRPIAPKSPTEHFELKAGTTLLPVEVRRVGERAIALQPTLLLSSNKDYTLSISGVTNIYGGSMEAAQTIRFQTQLLPDSTTLNLRTQADVLPLNATPVISFTRPLDAVALALGMVGENSNSSTVPVRYKLSEDRRSIYLIPEQPFLPGTHAITIQIPFDRFQKTQLGFSSSFTMTGDVDSTPARVLAVSPPDGSSEVPTAAFIEVWFDKYFDNVNVAQDGLRLSSDAGPVAGDWSFVKANGQAGLQFRQKSPLSPSTTYHLEVSGLADLTGGPVPPVSTTFTTGAANPSDPFRMLTVTPGNKAIVTDPLAPIRVTFNRAVSPVGPASPFFSLISRGSVGEFTPPPGKVEVQGSDITFTPLAPLPPGEYFVDGTGASDLSGSPPLRLASTFTIAPASPAVPDRTRVIRVSPGEGGMVDSVQPVVLLTFSNPVVRSTATTSNIVATGRRAGVLSVQLVTPTLAMVVLNAEPGSLVTLFVTEGVQDFSYQPVVPFRTTIQLRPEPKPAAKVVQIRPYSPSGVVSTTTSLGLVFDAPADHASVENSALITADGQFVNGRFEWTADSRGVTFLSDTPYPAGAKIYAEWGGTSFQRYVQEAPPGGAVASSLTGSFPSLPTDGVVDLQPAQDVTDELLASALCTWSEGSAPTPSPCTASRLRPGIIRLRPGSPMKPNGFYVTRFTAGGINWSSFITALPSASSADPHLFGGTPVAQPEGVPLNATLSVVFSTPVSSLSIQTAVKLSEGGSDVPVQSLRAGDQGIRVSPSTFLKENTEYTVTVSGVEDQAGRTIPPQSWTFTTDPAVDTTRLDILRVEPPVGGGAPDSVISMAFNKQIAADSALRTVSPLSGTLGFSEDRRSFTLTPDKPRSMGTSYYLWISNLQDIAENSISDSSANAFTTSDGFGHARPGGAPAPVSSTPRNGLEGVPLNARIQVKFDRRVLLAQATSTLTEDGVAIRTSLQIERDGQTVTLVPQRLPRAGALCEVRLANVTSADGSAVADEYAWSFRMGADLDLTSPTYRFFPVDGSTVPADTTPRIRFNERINPVLLDQNHVSLYTAEGFPLAANLSLEDDDRTVVVRPEIPLAPAKSYRLGVSGLTDLAGGPAVVSGSGLSATSFYIGESGPLPALRAVNPPNGSTSVAPDVVVQAYFDGPVDLPLGDANFRLLLGDQPVPGKIVYQSGKMFLLTPARPLSPGSVYTMELKGITGMDGRMLPDYSSTFTVQPGGAYAAYPRITSSTPAQNATGVPVDSKVVLNFAAPANPAWVSNAGIVEANGYRVAGSWSVEGATATFQPTFGFPPQRRVMVGKYLGPYSSGMALSDFLFFTTGDAVNAPGSELEATFPANDSLVPALTTHVVVRFTRPVITPTGVPPISLIAGSTGINAPFSTGEDGRTLAADINLPADNQITLVLSSQLKDMAGNPVKGGPVTFRTMTADESARPSVRKVTPANWAQNVSPSTPVVVEFNHAMDPASVVQSLFVADSGTLLAGHVENDETARLFQFTPDLPFLPGTQIEVAVDATAHDRNGWYASAFSSVFQTESPDQPAALVSYFASSEAVDLKFSQPVTVATAAISLRHNQQAVPVRVEQGGPDWLRLIPEQTLIPGETYQVTAGQDQAAAVTIEEHADRGRLATESVVRDDDGIVVRFNQPVNPVTFDRQRIRLRRTDGSSAPFHIWTGSDRQSLRLVPASSEGNLDLELEGIESAPRRRLEFQRTRGLAGRGAFRPAR
ncbi:Ig-like domain-containing protein [Paludibaculum fermentans]|uniref:Ig-like domain-containing protein n=1 Tax=Paludibaculum fermentans TaxID=1473598 RepID=A0A7S7SLS6_PALFE|nr:Ig-like domain-containing protein [Paludibaculum fermentans]QOY90562.1 Ig-like domain-containing protein [Paludibaculum fermentans]